MDLERKLAQKMIFQLQKDLYLSVYYVRPNKTDSKCRWSVYIICLTQYFFTTLQSPLAKKLCLPV